jgi:hypothetical protein
VATLAIAETDRQDLIDLLHRYGRRHPGAVTIADDCLTAIVRYTSRTPTHGHLREAFVIAVRPAGQKPRSAEAPHHRQGMTVVGPASAVNNGKGSTLPSGDFS